MCSLLGDTTRREVLSNHGCHKGRQRGATAVDNDKVLQLLKKGMTHAEVAKVMDCRTKTIQRIKNMSY